MRLPQIMVAPNGARLQKAGHAAVPVTQDEIVACARACFDAGAGGIHAHIRDAQGKHLLDAETYRALVGALHAAVPEMLVQITTEAAGVYGPAHQMQVALEAGAQSISVSIREICRADHDQVRQFIEACRAKGIVVQFILYDHHDADLLATTLSAAELESPDLQVLFVLGRYGGVAAKPRDLDPFTSWMSARKLSPDWAVCAFGPQEPDCLRRGAALGGKCRTGFENSLHLSNAQIAPDNASKVRELWQFLES